MNVFCSLEPAVPALCSQKNNFTRMPSLNVFKHDDIVTAPCEKNLSLFTKVTKHKSANQLCLIHSLCTRSHSHAQYFGQSWSVSTNPWQICWDYLVPYFSIIEQMWLNESIIYFNNNNSCLFMLRKSPSFRQ